MVSPGATAVMKAETRPDGLLFGCVFLATLDSSVPNAFE
jgi:hypothetical protein